ncbi:MAG: hypothetical protein COA47_10210 [Robiginitomaculum sp.]|nr:MAG: hypothetical protein COA47_10210 [Robiginitomaculum sp.]
MKQIRRLLPDKVMDIKFRIAHRKISKKLTKFNDRKCIACDGTGFISAGDGVIGSCICSQCNGTGKCFDFDNAIKVLF